MAMTPSARIPSKSPIETPRVTLIGQSRTLPSKTCRKTSRPRSGSYFGVNLKSQNCSVILWQFGIFTCIRSCPIRKCKSAPDQNMVRRRDLLDRSLNSLARTWTYTRCTYFRPIKKLVKNPWEKCEDDLHSVARSRKPDTRRSLWERRRVSLRWAPVRNKLRNRFHPQFQCHTDIRYNCISRFQNRVCCCRAKNIHWSDLHNYNHLRPILLDICKSHKRNLHGQNTSGHHSKVTDNDKTMLENRDQITFTWMQLKSSHSQNWP